MILICFRLLLWRNHIQNLEKKAIFFHIGFAQLDNVIKKKISGHDYYKCDAI